ncbi:unnamed protein product [Discosporangium mesarthrocarpum]
MCCSGALSSFPPPGVHRLCTHEAVPNAQEHHVRLCALLLRRGLISVHHCTVLYHAWPRLCPLGESLTVFLTLVWETLVSFSVIRLADRPHHLFLPCFLLPVPCHGNCTEYLLLFEHFLNAFLNTF